MAISDVTRRSFLREAGATVWSMAAGSRLALALPSTIASPVGYSIISWPPKDLNQALEAISTVGYQCVQLLGWVAETNTGDKVDELKDQLQKLKLSAAALSCSKVTLRPGSSETYTDQFRAYATFLHTLGGKVLQLIDGGKPSGNYSVSEIKAMGAQMNELGKMAKDSGMTVAYHPHYGTYGETRQGLGRVLDATDPRYVGMIADVAHLQLSGCDPAAVIRAYHQRLVMLHLKDARRDACDVARTNHDAVRKLPARFCEIGRGVVDFAAVTASLRKIHYKGYAMVELDSFVPPAGGPAESARINKDALHSLGFNI